MTEIDQSEGVSRRTLLVAGTAAIAGVSALAARASSAPRARFEPLEPTQDKKGAFTQSGLPGKPEAPEPVISARTIDIHYGKHHKAYVDNLNKLVEGKPYASQPLEEVIKASAKVEGDVAIFNNA